MNRPNTCTNLIKAVNRIAGAGRDALRLSRAIANVIVAQMLPDGVVKGGSSLMFRYGGDMTRYTRDMDTARVMGLEAYLVTTGRGKLSELRSDIMRLVTQMKRNLNILRILPMSLNSLDFLDHYQFR